MGMIIDCTSDTGIQGSTGSSQGMTRDSTVQRRQKKVDLDKTTTKVKTENTVAGKSS